MMVTTNACIFYEWINRWMKGLNVCNQADLNRYLFAYIQHEHSCWQWQQTVGNSCFFEIYVITVMVNILVSSKYLKNTLYSEINLHINAFFLIQIKYVLQVLYMRFFRRGLVKCFRLVFVSKKEYYAQIDTLTCCTIYNSCH